MPTIIDLFISAFEDEVKEVRAVIIKAKEISPSFRLTSSTRTVLELVNHMAQIPRLDIEIYAGILDSGEKAHAVELKLNKEKIADVLKVFDDGCLFLKKHLKLLTDEQLFEKKLKPFYETNPTLKSWSYYFPKIITHLALHKGILWSYLKVAGAKVNMMTYYGVVEEKKD